MGFVDAFLTQKKRGSSRIEQLGGLIDWSLLSKQLDAIVTRSPLGRKGYEPLSLFKALVLQKIYNLSDPQMEEMLYDRLSFRHFCGFELDGSLPDETTLCKFRNSLAGHEQDLLDLVLISLAQKGLKLNEGVIVDATVTQSRSTPPRNKEVSLTDPEAGWTKKRGKFVYGYKKHACVDAKQGLIHKIQVTGAEVHDGHVFGQLLSEEDEKVYADKAYASKKNRALLSRFGLIDCVLYKAKRGTPQPRWEKDLNRLWNKTRSGVERTFAHLKGQYGFARTRFFGIEANQLNASLTAIAYNLSRAEKILRPPILKNEFSRG